MATTFTIPTIETERLILRAWREDDLDNFVDFWADAEQTKYVGGTRQRTEIWRAMSGANGGWSMRGCGMMAVESKETGELVGNAGLHFPEGWPEREVGWIILPQHQRKGYASEAAIGALKYAYLDLGWQSAVSLIDKGNIASEGVAKKLGAHMEQKDVSVTDFVSNIWRHLPPEEFLAAYGGQGHS
ncbi:MULTISPECIES: GNAT family N-acetyltransferase [unclassified Lentilitoribacter]|jgi:ribosomal-protein-alanine N-acetyltransferase|uniref:GNAT family N-acetyltransferase n=1 Tax=unclassified Lentilitoribacter TaxID=2647570 RepID=UPI0013A6A824|nr:GNAT family N-acetyltransferase [Lentilitoribacter sp. Alg239-R112]